MKANSVKHFIFSRMVKAVSMLCASALFLAGCVQMAPVPNYARAGDTLVLGLGGIQRNAQGNQAMSASDLLVTITDSAGTTHTLTPLLPFKAFPDYGSAMNYQTMIGTGTTGTVMSPLPIQPFDGGWFVPVPLTSGPSTPLVGLAVGPATISVTSPTGKLVNNPSLGNFGASPNAVKEGNMLSIPVEIIAGTSNPASTASDDYDNQFRAYSMFNVPSFNVAPSSLLGITEVGGMQVAIKYTSASTKVPMAVPYSHNPSINLQQNVVDNGDGSKTLNVMLTAPKGFSSTPTPFKPTLRDLNIKVINFVGTGTTFQILSSKYIDTSGNVISGMSAVVGPLVL